MGTSKNTHRTLRPNRTMLPRIALHQPPNASTQGNDDEPQRAAASSSNQVLLVALISVASLLILLVTMVAVYAAVHLFHWQDEEMIANSRRHPLLKKLGMVQCGPRRRKEKAFIERYRPYSVPPGAGEDQLDEQTRREGKKRLEEDPQQHSLTETMPERKLPKPVISEGGATLNVETTGHCSSQPDMAEIQHAANLPATAQPGPKQEYKTSAPQSSRFGLPPYSNPQPQGADPLRSAPNMDHTRHSVQAAKPGPAPPIAQFPIEPPEGAITTYLTYSRRDREHCTSVRKLADWLRTQGAFCSLCDIYEQPIDYALYVDERMNYTSDFIIVCCTPEYLQCWEMYGHRERFEDTKDKLTRVEIMLLRRLAFDPYKLHKIVLVHLHKSEELESSAAVQIEPDFVDSCVPQPLRSFPTYHLADIHHPQGLGDLLKRLHNMPH